MDSTTRKWALITGVSAGGTGNALAQELISKSMRVIATAPTLAQLDYLPDDERLAKIELDVTSSSSIAAAVSQASQITDGSLHFLVNNAGYGYMAPLIDANPAAVQANFDVNVFALLTVTQAFFPLLLKAKGIVANQCSIAGLRAGRQPFIGVYSATKAAAISLSDTMRVELKPFGIKVVTLVTGDVRTQFWKNVHGAYSGLPEGSIYWPIKDHAEAMMRGETNPLGGHSPERWAKEVVNDLLKSTPGSYSTHGFLGRTLSIVSWLAPSWLIDYAFTKSSGLSNLEKVPQDGGSRKTQ